MIETAIDIDDIAPYEDGATRSSVGDIYAGGLSAIRHADSVLKA